MVVVVVLQYLILSYNIGLSVLWCCWLGGRKGIRPVKHCVVGCWYGYLSGARCRMQMCIWPSDPTATHCLLLQEIQIGFTFLVLADPSSPGQNSESHKWCSLTTLVNWHHLTNVFEAHCIHAVMLYKPVSAQLTNLDTNYQQQWLFLFWTLLVACKVNNIWNFMSKDDVTVGTDLDVQKTCHNERQKNSSGYNITSLLWNKCGQKIISINSIYWIDMTHSVEEINPLQGSVILTRLWHLRRHCLGIPNTNSPTPK